MIIKPMARPPMIGREIHTQNTMVAARQMARATTWAQRSQRAAMRR
jgi:hypothetical protein